MTLHAVVRFVADLVRPWHRARARCLGLLVYALMRGQRLGVAQIGRHLSSRTTDKHRIKAVDRFLGNDKVDLHELWAQLIALASHSSRTLHVFIDWTDLPGEFEMLQAAVSFGGRSLPIAWVTTRQGHYGRSRNIIRRQSPVPLPLCHDKRRERQRDLVPDYDSSRAGLLVCLPRDCHIREANADRRELP